MTTLHGKVALVTGASRGIGVALGLAQAGAKVFATGRSVNSESPEFIGRAVAALAGDPHVMRWTGAVLVAAALAEEYGFNDVDGRQPRALTLAGV
jgi:NAD(P)-dependent dehydrogenase (short-subunit alcohol dehydrogenase family)